VCCVNNDAVSAEADVKQSHLQPVGVHVTVDLARSVTPPLNMTGNCLGICSKLKLAYDNASVSVCKLFC